MSINKTLFQQKLDELKRAGNERRFKELQSKYQSPEAIDYSNMSLRDELQTRFDLDELNRLSAELGKDINSGVNISSNSANTLASRSPSNDFDGQNSFSQPLSRPNNANDAMVSSLKASNPSSQNSFYTAAGIPTPNYKPIMGDCSIGGFVNKFNELNYMKDIPHTISTGNKIVDKGIAKIGSTMLNLVIKDPRLKMIAKAGEKMYPYIEDAGARLAQIKAAYSEICKNK